MLMEKCYDCYAENGLASVGIRKLAESCGCSSAVLYIYFRDLDDLIVQSTAYCMKKVEDDFMAKAPTGSGKTFTMAKVIEKIQRPTLVLAHNKTLAAQLCAEFKEFFPNNAVEYFVSYYDYYQPEAISPTRTPLLRRIRPSMRRSTGSACRPPPLCWSGGT